MIAKMTTNELRIGVWPPVSKGKGKKNPSSKSEGPIPSNLAKFD